MKQGLKLTSRILGAISIVAMGCSMAAFAGELVGSGRSRPGAGPAVQSSVAGSAICDSYLDEEYTSLRKQLLDEVPASQKSSGRAGQVKDYEDVRKLIKNYPWLEPYRNNQAVLESLYKFTVSGAVPPEVAERYASHFFNLSCDQQPCAKDKDGKDIVVKKPGKSLRVVLSSGDQFEIGPAMQAIEHFCMARAKSCKGKKDSVGRDLKKDNEALRAIANIEYHLYTQKFGDWNYALVRSGILQESKADVVRTRFDKINKHNFAISNPAQKIQVNASSSRASERSWCDPTAEP